MEAEELGCRRSPRCLPTITLVGEGNGTNRYACAVVGAPLPLLYVMTLQNIGPITQYRGLDKHLQVRHGIARPTRNSIASIFLEMDTGREAMVFAGHRTRPGETSSRHTALEGWVLRIYYQSRKECSISDAVNALVKGKESIESLGKRHSTRPSRTAPLPTTHSRET